MSRPPPPNPTWEVPRIVSTSWASRVIVRRDRSSLAAHHSRGGIGASARLRASIRSLARRSTCSGVRSSWASIGSSDSGEAALSPAPRGGAPRSGFGGSPAAGCSSSSRKKGHNLPAPGGLLDEGPPYPGDLGRFQAAGVCKRAGRAARERALPQPGSGPTLRPPRPLRLPCCHDQGRQPPPAGRLPRAGREGQARAAQAVHRLRRGRGQDLPHARGGARAGASGGSTSRSGSSRPTGAQETAALVRGPGGGPPPPHRVPGGDDRGDEPQQHPQAQPGGGAGRRAGPHQRARQPQQEALPGRARAAGRRHQRHRRLQRAAPREPQRHRRAGDRRGGARDDPRQLPQAGRPGREPGPGRRGPAGAAARRQDLRRRQDPLGAASTSSRTATWPTCASWPCARWPRAWSGPASPGASAAAGRQRAPPRARAATG